MRIENPQPSGTSVALTPTATKTANYTAVAGDLVPVDATSGAKTVTLPASPTNGQQVAVYKTDATANTVTVAGTIDGTTNAVISTQYFGATFTYVSAGSMWKITAAEQVTGPAGPTGATGPTGPTGPPGPTGPAGSASAVWSAGVLNAWYPATAMASVGQSNRQFGNGDLVVGTPVVAQEAMTIDRIGCLVQTAGASTFVRLGIWKVSSSNPFDLTLGSVYSIAQLGGGDTGQISAATTGQKDAALPSPAVLAAGDAFVIGVAVQGPNAVYVYCETPSYGYAPWGAPAIIGGSNSAFKITGATGALPTTLTPASWFTAGVGGGGWYRRSA